LANIVRKASIPGKTEVILDRDLPIQCPVIEPFQFEMIDRVNLVTEIFQGTDQGLRHVLVEKDFH
jgi:hypothetical protein